jgi:hypothetical protein
MALPPYGSGPPWVPGGVPPQGVPPGPPPVAAPAPRLTPYVGNANFSFTTVNVTSKALPLFASAGNGVVVFANGPTLTGVTDQFGSLYLQAASAQNTGNGFISLWYCARLLGPNPTITAAFASGSITLHALEIVGANPQFFVDAAGIFITVGQSPLAAPFVTSSPGSLIVSMEATTAGSTNTLPVGYATHWQVTAATGNGRSTVGWSNAPVAVNTPSVAWTNTGGSLAGVATIAIRSQAQFPDQSTLRNVPLPVAPPGARTMAPGQPSAWPPYFPEVVPVAAPPAATQYYGEDAELETQDDDEQVDPAADYQLVENLSPVDDAWDHFTTDGDDYAVSDDYAFIENLSPVDDPWDHWPTDDDDQVDVVEFQIPGVAAYYGEDAELFDQDDDDQVVVDSQPQLQGDAPIEDGWDWWSQDDDDHADQLDDYALVENLNPVEDAWDHFAQDDDEQVDVAEFQLQSVALTTLQYYGEDAELLDQDDDDQAYPDLDRLGADFFAPPQYFGDDAELEIQDGDEWAPVDEQVSFPDALGFDDPWYHFADDADEFTQDEYQAAVAGSALLCAEDAYDHWPTDDADEYYVADDFELPATFTALIGGVAFGASFSLGTLVGPVPQPTYRYDKRFFNGSNAWLGFRTASGGGVW